MSVTALLSPALTAFQVALAAPQAAQTHILTDILRRNADSAFGRRHGFGHIGGYADFVRRVPVQTYESLCSQIHAAADGQRGILTCEPVGYFEETGGSTGGTKLVPYTASLLAAFRRAVLPWLADLQRQSPQVFDGKLFFIVSPAVRRHTHTAGGLPIGNGSDLAYLGSGLAEQFAARTLFQPELAAAQTAEQWQWHCARVLMQAQDLSLISLWSPTLLLAVLHTMQQAQDSLLATVADPSRRQRLARALAREQPDFRSVWPQLRVVSAWSSHTAAAAADAVRALLPQAWLQGKGLLATEAVSSIPFSGCPQPLLAVDSHFYEFLDEHGTPFTAASVRPDREYRLLVTTQGGLYRYDSGDHVRIHSLHDGVPTLEFVGRGSLCSDLCGEKFTEAFVRRAMLQADARLCRDSLLQGVAADPPYYCLWAEHGNGWLSDDVVARLDEALAANPQYAYARRIGQLGAPVLQRTDSLAAVAARHHRPDQRLSTRKTALLLPAADQTAIPTA